MTLTLLRGPSGSGKTTYAKTLDAEHVSRDKIRRKLTGDPGKFAGDNKFEAKVTKIETEQVRDLLIARKDVVIDDTNLIDRFARNWLDMANDYGHEYEVVDFDVPLDELLERNRLREPNEQVPENVIRSQWNRFQGTTVNLPPSELHPYVDWTPVEPCAGPYIVTCDLDGTLAETAAGFSVYDPTHYWLDTMIRPTQEVLTAMLAQGFEVKFLSGRGEEHRGVTEAWLEGKAGFKGELFMRKERDKRRDDAVKVEMFNENIRGRYNVLFHLDDRNRVVNALRAIGVTVHQVANGNF